jgi:hypothetical protein
MKSAFRYFLMAIVVLFYGCGNRSTSGQPVSYYKVPLVCGAAPGIGCGSRIKPFFLETAKQSKIKESWSNRQGTVIAIVWADDFKDEKAREALIQPLFQKHAIDAALTGEENEINALGLSFGKDKWYKGMDIDQLSLEEAGVIANEMVTFAKGKALMNNSQADSIKTEIENYFKVELVKVRSVDELGSQATRNRWRSELGEIVAKYIGKERTNELSDAYMRYRDEIEKAQESCCKEDKKDCCKKPEQSLTSQITCPKCGHTKTEILPTDICLLSYTCEKCQALLHPEKGDCCVFCTYGDQKCPSKQ